MKSSRHSLKVFSTAILLAVAGGGSLLAQSTSASKVRNMPGPNPDLFDGSKAEEESRPESGIISDFEMGSGESAPQSSQSPNQQQEQQNSQGQQQGGGGGGSGPEGTEQGQGGGGSEEMIEEGEMPEQQQGQQGQQGDQQSQQGGQQGGQQSQSSSSSSSSSSQKGGQQPPQNNVKLGDDSLKIDTVEMPADESLIGQEETRKPATEDTGAGGASGKQGPRQNTGVEQGDAMPSDI